MSLLSPFPRPLPRLLLGAALLAAAHAGAQPAVPGTPALPAAVSSPGTDLRGAASVTVQPGDTAFSLARRAGLGVEALLALNGLSRPDLRVGQILRLSAPSAPAALLTHTVQPGETLYALARRYGVNVDALLAANDLAPGAGLKVAQILTLPAGASDQGPASAPRAPTPPPAPPTPGVGGSPFVPGAPGQVAPVLQPAGPMPRVQGPGVPQASAPPSTQFPAQPSAPAPGAAPASGAASSTASGGLAGDWRTAAMALVGTPYVLGGEGRSGTDCSGFVRQVFTPLGVRLPRVSADQAQAGEPVADADLQPGDLLFFDTLGQGRVSHVGIYLGDDHFVSANSYLGRVSVDTFRTDRYWGPRFLWARRVLNTPLAMGH